MFGTRRSLGELLTGPIATWVATAGLQPDHRDVACDLHLVFGVQIQSALFKGGQFGISNGYMVSGTYAGVMTG